MRIVRIAMLGVLLAACGTAPAVTPQIIYVTPEPEQTSTGGPAVVVTQPPATISPSTPRPTRAATAEPDTRAELEIVDFGFTRDDEEDVASDAVVVHNPNPSRWVGDFWSLQITFFDDEGPTKTESEYVSFILPSQTTAVAGTSFDVGRPNRMEVRLGSGDWTEIDFTHGEFTISSVRTRDEEFGGHRTTGTITSEFQSRQENIQIVAVYRNGAGEILGGDITFLDFLDPSTDASFEITTFMTLPDLETTEIYWHV